MVPDEVTKAKATGQIVIDSYYAVRVQVAYCEATAGFSQGRSAARVTSMLETRFATLEYRADDSLVSGIALRYGDTAMVGGQFKERFDRWRVRQRGRGSI